MKKITLLTVFLLTTISAFAQAPEWDWVFTSVQPEPVDENEDVGMSVMGVETDTQGNTYLNCMSIGPSVTFGDQTFTGSTFPPGRAYLLKFDSAGNIVWIKDTHANDMAWFIGMTTDVSGNVYATGGFTGSFDFQGTVLSSSENYIDSSFISKMDSNGNLLWANLIGAEGDNAIVHTHDILKDPSGNLYISGQMGGTTGIFGDITVPIQTQSDTFLAKYDSNGNVIWVKTARGSSYQGWGCHLVCDSSGNIYMSGNGDTITFEGTVLGAPASSITYVVKYSPGGDLLWIRSQEGTSSTDIFSSNIGIDASNNIYTGGYFNSASVSFGDIVLTNPNSGQNQNFVAKYDSNGTIIWAKSSGGVGYDIIQDINVGNDGTVYLAGNFSSPQIVLGDTTLFNEGNSNSYIAKMDTNGNFLWAEQIGGSANNTSYMAVDYLQNNVFVSGIYGNARFGDETYASMTGNLYFAKYGMGDLAIKNFNQQGVKLYPNPAKNILNINDELALGQIYTITDMTGRKIKSDIVENAIDISSLFSGLYTFTTNNKSVKFIKE